MVAQTMYLGISSDVGLKLFLNKTGPLLNKRRPYSWEALQYSANHLMCKFG